MRTHSSPSRYARAALVALCCSLLPALAVAQTSSGTKATTKKKTQKKPAQAAPAPAAERPAPAPVKERTESEERPVYAPAPREEAPERPARRSARAAEPTDDLVGKLEVEGSLGLAIPFETGMNTGFKLNAGGYYGLMQLTPTILLQVGGNFGITRNGYDVPSIPGVSTSGSTWLFDFLPTARLRFAINEKLHAMADGGLGLGIAYTSFSGGGISQSDTSAAFLLKLGGGVGYDMNEKLSLVALPAFNIYVKDGSVTEFTLLVGATMKL